MVEMQVRYEGGLHTLARHGPSASQIETDAPVDNQGRGEAFSPTDLLGASLATCMLTTMAIRAEPEGWPLDGATARIEKHMALEPRRRVGRLVVEIDAPAGIPLEARAPLEGSARGCPVACSLSPQVEVDLTIRWG
jgi:putative redox protein